MLNRSIIFYILAIISVGISMITFLINNVPLTLFFITIYVVFTGLRYHYENKEHYEYSEDFKEQFK